MQPISDLLIDRKRLKQQLMQWRSLALVVIFGSLAFYFGGSNGGGAMRVAEHDYIAQITIEGVMEDDKKRDDMLKDVLNDPHAKAVILRLDSPGGTTFAGEEIYLQLRAIAAKKPVVGVMRTLCASACFMASLAADHVVAREGTLTGSIGVLLQSVEISRLVDRLGITPVTIKSGPYKDVPDMAQPFTDEQRKVVSQAVMDAYDHFLRLLMERRHMDDAQARQLADGRVYTGHQAFTLKLIDGLGGTDEALEWLAKNKHIDPKLEVEEIAPEPAFDSLWQKLGQYTGIKIFNHSPIGLDGLVSIWHPSPVQ
jgi:protease-4